MEKKIDYTKPIYAQSGGSYDVCIPPYQGYQVTSERDPGLFAEIEAKVKSGEVVPVPEPVPPPPTPEALASQARALRDARLVANDRQIIIASRVQRTGDTAATVRLAALDAYAVALCDWPESEGFPDLSTIPVTPIIN